MPACDDCGFEASTPQGLASHRAWKHQAEPGGEQSQACEETIRELKRLGRIERIDTAKAEAVRGIARQLDLNPANSQMWREYREGLNDLLGVEDDDDGTDDVIAQIRSAASLGDTASA